MAAEGERTGGGDLEGLEHPVPDDEPVVGHRHHGLLRVVVQTTRSRVVRRGWSVVADAMASP
ncbi:hypothetical protein GCM10009714_27780 [Microlunatus capsulatus]